MPENDKTTEWTILEPDLMTSTAGAILSLQPDGSVFVNNAHSFLDTHTVEAVAKLSGITALRLEVMPDHRLPNHGPGCRPGNGDFALNSIRLFASRPQSKDTPVKLTRASSAYSKPPHGVSHRSATIDRDQKTLWTASPRFGQHQQAVFQPAYPIANARGQRLRVELDGGLTGYAYFILGRFRLAITNRTFPLFGTSLQMIKAGEMQNGLTRLGAARCLLGEWQDAESVLSRAASRSDATALEFFLLALARDHIEKHAEAQSDCNRALALLKSDKPEQVTIDVAVEALMTIRGASVDEAQALVFDAAFPADPFSR